MQTSALTHSQQTEAAAPGKLLGRLLRGMPELQWITQHHDKRKAAESYIADKFHQEHNACIKDFMPHLLTINCLGNFTAAVGLRSACSQSLFVEHYLDQPAIELIAGISQNTGLHPRHIIELGNLVSTQRGSSQLLFILLTALLFRADVRWVIFTASCHVQSLLKKIGLTSITVCRADKNQLPDGGASWGSYYDNNPCVTLIPIQEAFQTLSGNRISASLLHNFDLAISKQAASLKQLIGRDRAGML